MTQELMEVTLAGVRLRVPVYLDPETTLAIAERVNDRIKAIEAASTRIDSQAFALTAAFEFATELHAANAERDQDHRDLTKRLNALTSRLDTILTDFADLG